MRADAAGDVLYRADLLQILIGKRNLEVMFECHQLHRTQALDEGGVKRDLVLVDTKPVDDDCLHVLFNRRQSSSDFLFTRQRQA